MNDQDYELLSQYLDGELDVFATRRLEQRLTQEQGLQSLLEQMKAQDTALKAAFTGTDKAPASIAAKLQSNVVSLPQKRAQRPAWQYAVAASLVAAAGLLLMPSTQQAPGGDSMLASVLEYAPSMSAGWETLEDGRQVRPVLSFKHSEGQWCREYLVTSGFDSSRGVACRHDSGWNTKVIAKAEIPGSNGDFRPASASDIDEVADYMIGNAEGIALSASEEAELIKSSWK